jgi:hypothetical protein
LLKLSFTAARSTVAKYMAKTGGGSSGQSWNTFLRNHMPHILAIDLFVIPTVGFRFLHALTRHATAFHTLKGRADAL